MDQAIKAELDQAIAAAEEVKSNPFSNEDQLEKAALALDAAVVKAKADQDVLENSDELTQAKADLAGAITDALTDAEDFDGQAEIDALKAVMLPKMRWLQRRMWLHLKKHRLLLKLRLLD
ncbi:hypothetical protein BS636_14435 [Acinetobacter sp. LoGeW2-3]|uniref:hypothetical protein n=1 Tax=Acinetobacter sp. LoGeW2-3 TaxID=1808001 RepID=UPI000C05A659|nr:hypothetical protein [Acinetobacter sp. LoGeW2-3]ATO20792.1 hypothetical protein BS636_14435 [Acinetobacter sp. LoGeW2-3]